MAGESEPDTVLIRIGYYMRSAKRFFSIDLESRFCLKIDSFRSIYTLDPENLWGTYFNMSNKIYKT